MRKKNIPFSFLVGDLPTYKTIVQLKAENPEMYKDIIPILGAFHQQMSYIYAIYKRFKGSGMADTLVTAGHSAGFGCIPAALKVELLAAVRQDERSVAGCPLQQMGGPAGAGGLKNQSQDPREGGGRRMGLVI
ncbi:hypothetical protein KUDE01_018689 [Dissostichus eleginoides]|uniref:Uncharacterized protein n=1 Tax=Dissostichus eleginoides TaxID=100907 RepID=A0AAD9FE28_DISEL|nr:hypothetical protein KUDE01_018689 [Dissostichus eleginoides]